jgi:hypothetical protein
MPEKWRFETRLTAGAIVQGALLRNANCEDEMDQLLA